ncbi:hypothetical protein ABZP36_007473 [Zizania latifolia]
MLSSEQPSGPSCSSKSSAPGVSADPATSPAQAPAFHDPTDLVQPCLKFSIRDYVFTSRSKDIKNSWPFHPRSLQICQKHGVKDPLPPFEPPDLIRVQSLNTTINVEQSAACSEANAPVGLVKTRYDGSSNVNTSNISFQSCQPVDESPGLLQYTSPEDGKSAVDQGENTNGLDHIDEAIPVDLQDNSCTKAIRQTEVVVPSWRSKNLDLSWEPSEKNGKLVVKLGSLTRAEEVVSNSSTVSDPMASKTCPVCKVFASTSNTTLNAHMDQCLSVESNTELVETVFLKPKVKPRKKRLMVDIYKTAQLYTLEDLDRRNGTNWAVELAISTTDKEVCTENRSPEVVPSDPRDDEREGAVYVDSNGIKIRILSKSSDASLLSRDEHSSRKVAKHETGKGLLMTKTCSKSKLCKNKTLKVLGKKNSKLDRLNTQVQACTDGDMHERTSEEEEEEPTMHVPKPTESTSYCSSQTMRQWVGSKRSGLSKNCGQKFTDKASNGAAPGTKKLVRSSMHCFDDSQISESRTEAFSSQSPEEMVTTSEANDDDQRSGSSRLLRSIPRWSSKTTPSSIVIPKVPRSAAALAKRKIQEIGRREAYRSDNYDMVRNPTSIRSSVGRGPSSVAGVSGGSNRVASTKKFRKNRSQLRTGRREFSPSSSGLVHRFGQDHEPVPRHMSKKFRVDNKETSKKLEKHTQEDTSDNDCSYGNDVPALGQEDDQYDVAQQAASAQMDYEGEEPETEMQYASASRSNPADCSNEMSSDSLSPENNETADEVLAEDYSVAMVDQCSNEKSAHHAHVPNIAANNEVEEWQIDPSSTKESSACLTNNRDMGLGAPQDNSSITSNREDSNIDHGLVFDRGSSESPISTASTMSPPTSLKDSRINMSEPGPSTANFRTVEERVSGTSIQETKSAEAEQLPKKPFCCNCRESISRESQLHHQGETARPMPTFTGRQVPQLNIGLRSSSSFSTYQRTSTKANPCLDSHDQTLAGKVSAEPTNTMTRHPSYMADCMSPSLQTQLPSPSNPILRLMGKNLMVMNSEESGHPQAPSSDYVMRGNYMQPVSFVPQNYQHIGDPAFMNMAPSTVNHQIPLSSVQAGNFVGPPLHSGSMVQPEYHSAQKPYRNLVPVMHHPTYMMKEVIMINDSPERRSNPQVSMLLSAAPSPATISVANNVTSRPFYCVPSQNQILPRESAVGSLPVFPSMSPMVGVSSSSQGSKAEVPHPYMSNPIYMQSPAGYMNPPIYYSQNLR